MWKNKAGVVIDAIMWSLFAIAMIGSCIIVPIGMMKIATDIETKISLWVLIGTLTVAAGVVLYSVIDTAVSEWKRLSSERRKG